MKKLLLGTLLGSIAFAMPKIEVKDAWVREVPSTSKMSAAYMIIENKGTQADKLIDASNNVSKVTELHETVDGKMRKVKFIEVPAGGKAELKPGGLHIMLIDLNRQLKEGESVDLTLKFEKSGEMKVTAPVKKAPGMEKHMKGHTNH